MIIYSNPQEAIRGLRGSGFTADFQLFGNDLLWNQEKIFIRSYAFSIVEFYRFGTQQNNDLDLVICGISIYDGVVKGILKNQYFGLAELPPVILRKVRETQGLASVLTIDK